MKRRRLHRIVRYALIPVIAVLFVVAAVFGAIAFAVLVGAHMVGELGDWDL